MGIHYIRVTWWKGHKVNLEMASNSCKSHELANWDGIRACGITSIFKKKTPQKIHPPAPSLTIFHHHFKRGIISLKPEANNKPMIGWWVPETSRPLGHLGNSNFVFSNSSRFVAAAKAATFRCAESFSNRIMREFPYWIFVVAYWNLRFLEVVWGGSQSLACFFFCFEGCVFLRSFSLCLSHFGSYSLGSFWWSIPCFAPWKWICSCISKLYPICSN